MSVESWKNLRHLRGDLRHLQFRTGRTDPNRRPDFASAMVGRASASRSAKKYNLVGMDTMLTTGELARQAGVLTSTVRRYERCRLLGPAQRSPGNYRLYDARALDRLRFIRAAQTNGFNGMTSSYCSISVTAGHHRVAKSLGGSNRNSVSKKKRR